MKFKKYKGLFNFSLIKRCVSILLLIVVYSCENKLEEIKEITESVNVNIEMAKDVEIKYTEHGKLKAILIAPELLKDNTSKNPYTEFKEGVNLKLYNKVQEQTGFLQSDYAIKYEKAQETLVSGKVIVENENGNKLETEELKRNDKTGELTTDKFVVITTEKEKVWGTGLIANEDFSWYKIDSMEGTMQIDKSEF